MGLEVVLTEAAREAISRTRAARGNDLSLVIGNGCCDSTAPFLFAAYAPGPAEEPVGEADGVTVYLDRALGELFEGREVVIDATDDDGADSFSCETELGVRLCMTRLPLPR